MTDAEAFGHWSRFLLANRETAELRLEEQQRRGAGTAAGRLATGPGAGLAGQPRTHPAGRYGLAGCALGDPTGVSWPWAMVLPGWRAR